MMFITLGEGGGGARAGGDVYYAGGPWAGDVYNAGGDIGWW